MVPRTGSFPEALMYIAFCFGQEGREQGPAPRRDNLHVGAVSLHRLDSE